MPTYQFIILVLVQWRIVALVDKCSDGSFHLSVDFGPGGGPMGGEFEAAALPREEFKLKTTSTASKLKPQLAVMEIANGGFCGRNNHLDIPLRLE